MRNNKVTEKPQAKPEKSRKNPLESFKLWYERGNHPKHYISPTAGQRPPRLHRWAKTVVRAVIGFVLDISAAIKTIIKEIM